MKATKKNQFTLPDESESKGNLPLALVFVILVIAVIVLAAALIGMTKENTRLEEAITERDLLISELNAKITEKDSLIAAYDGAMKKLHQEVDNLKNEMSFMGAKLQFLSPWAQSIANRIEKTFDFRPLTILKCDNVATWLRRQVEKFREHERVLQ